MSECQEGCWGCFESFDQIQPEAALVSKLDVDSKSCANKSCAKQMYFFPILCWLSESIGFPRFWWCNALTGCAIPKISCPSKLSEGHIP
eukprot:1825195-Amphidinium_carterae.2